MFLFPKSLRHLRSFISCQLQTSFRKGSKNVNDFLRIFSFSFSTQQIALESVFVIDDGETMLVQALRVAPQERGKGVIGVLQRFCSDLVKSKFPDVKVTRLTRDQLGPKDFQKYRLITKQVQATSLSMYRLVLYKPQFKSVGYTIDVTIYDIVHGQLTHWLSSL